MRRSHHLLAIALLLALATVVCASEFEHYPQFRYASGLPGGNFGVDPEGHAGFDGAMQITIPVGYTPGAGNYALGASAGSVDGSFPTHISGASVNGSVPWGFGVNGPDHALWVADMNTGKGRSGESAYNAQFQVKRQDERWPGISVGVLDWADQRAAHLSRPFAGGGRSFFTAATWEGGTPDKPLYYTVGLGTRRYNGLFGGVSYQPARRVKLMAEYDGWSANLGTAYEIARYEDNWHLTGMLSLIDLDRWDVGFALTRSSHK